MPTPVAISCATAAPVLLSSSARLAVRLTPVTPLNATVPLALAASPALVTSNAPLPSVKFRLAVPALSDALTPVAPAVMICPAPVPVR